MSCIDAPFSGLMVPKIQLIAERGTVGDLCPCGLTLSSRMGGGADGVDKLHGDMGVDQKVRDTWMTIGWKTTKKRMCQSLNGKTYPWSFGGQEY